MNQLTRIQALNLKGKSHDAKLTALTAVVGPNAGGKSAIGAALTIALLGHIPALGKQPKATIQLMTPEAPMLDVQAVLASGERINRRIDVNPKSKACKAANSGPDFTDGINPVQLDFDQFRAAKPTERQRILEGLLAATADETVVEDARTRVAKTGLDLAVRVGEGWLLKLEADAKDALKLAKQESDTAAKTILQLQAEEQPEAFDVDALKTTQATLAKARETLGATRSTLDTLADAQQNAPDQPEGEEVTEAMIQAAVEEEFATSNRVDAWKGGKQAYDAAVKHAEEIQRPHTGIEPREVQGGVLTADELNAQARRLASNKSELTTAYGIAKSNLAQARTNLAKALEHRDKMLAGDCCPTCKTQGEAFKAAFEKAAETAITELTQAVQDAQDRETKLSGDIDAFVAQEERHRQQCKDREQNAAHLAKVRAMEAMNGVRLPQGELAPLEAAHTAAKGKLATLRREAQQWISWRAAKIPTAEQLATADKEFRDAKAAVESLEVAETALKEREQKIAGWRANQAKIAELERENVKRAAEMEAMKDLAAWAKAKSLELTAEAMKPLLGVSNFILGGLVEGQIAIEGTSVGVNRNGHLIPLEVLSGSEAVALSAAIQVAIAGSSPFRIVMIDELSRFATERKQRFVQNLASAIDGGLIDQAIVFDHDARTGLWAAEYPAGSSVDVA